MVLLNSSFQVWLHSGGLFLSACILLILIHLFRQRQEIAKRKRVEEDLKAANETMSRVNEENKLISRMVAHDLRSPLTHIMMHVDSLLAEQNPAAGKTSTQTRLEKISFQTDRIHQMVNQLNEINTLEGGNGNFTTRPVNLVDWARIAAQGHTPLADRKDISLKTEWPERELMVIADPDPLLQIIENLLSNAIKYTPEGQQIGIRIREEAGKGLIEVWDQGPGIPLDEQDKLFKKFSRLSTRPTGGENSLGLGLAIVKHLTEAMKGEVSCLSQPGEGSVFRVSFPLA